MNSLIDRIGKHPWFVFTVGILTVWGELIKPLLDRPSTMNWNNYFHNINYIFVIGQFLILFMVYISLKTSNETKAHFLLLSHDMAAFTHQYQGNFCISKGDVMGAYYHYIHSIKFSLKANNLNNVQGELKAIKEQILPFMCKDYIELMKKDKMLDIEDAFKHIALSDKNMVFSHPIQDIRAIINRLPQSQPKPIIVYP